MQSKFFSDIEFILKFFYTFFNINQIGLSSRMGQKYRKKEESIRNNLKQYGFEAKYLDVLIADFSTTYIRNELKFDAIITDPPYVKIKLRK